MRYVTGANGVQIPELTRQDMRALSDLAWQSEAKALAATLELAGVDPETRLKELKDHNLQRGTAGPLFMSTFTFEGVDAIIAKACAAAKMDVGAFTSDLTTEQLCDVARLLIGVRPKEVQQGE